MRARLIPLTTIGVLLAGVLLAFGMAACGGGGNDDVTLTVEEYFRQLEPVAVRYDERGSELSDELAASAPETDAEAVAASQQFLRGALGLLEEFVNELASFDPPPEVEDAHFATVQAGRAALAGLRDVVGRADGVESASELEPLFEEIFGETAAFTEFADRCEALQQIADDNDIAADLRCGE